MHPAGLSKLQVDDIHDCKKVALESVFRSMLANDPDKALKNTPFFSPMNINMCRRTDGNRPI